MAILNSTLTTDLQLATALEMQIQHILGEDTSLETSGIVINSGTINGTGAVAKQIPFAQMHGTEGMTSRTEVQAITETGITDTSLTVTVARFASLLGLSDLAGGSNKVGIDPAWIANLLVNRRRFQVNATICGTFASLTTTAGSTGAALSVTNMYAAQFAAREALLPALPGGFYVAVLKNATVNELITSIRSESGALEHRSDIQNLTIVKSDAFAGAFGNTLIIGHDQVADDSTDYDGALLGAGSIYAAYLDPELPPPGTGLAMKFGNLPGFMLEANREAAEARSEWIANQWHGMSIRPTNGVKIISGV